MKTVSRDGFEGCLLGLMVGDCLGLPREGLSPERAQRMFPGEPAHAFLPGLGMASDDTEHACFTAQALLEAGDASELGRLLAWKLRLWLLGLPAGVGLATLRSALKLWIGYSPENSGVYSAGNGAAMRAPILGAAYWDDPRGLEAAVLASTRLTHTDPRAYRGALAAAAAVRYGLTHGPGRFSVGEFLEELAGIFPAEDAEASAWLARLRKSAENGFEPGPMGFSQEGISGYVYDTISAALWAWLAGPFDFEGGMNRILSLGGDTDTAGAVFGGLCGAAAGASAIPAAWVEGIRDFPRSTAWVRRLGARLHRAFVLKENPGPQPFFWPFIAVRNPFFMGVVLLHGFWRVIYALGLGLKRATRRL